MAARSTPIPIDTETAIHELARLYQQYFNARQTDKILDLFTEDGSLLAPNRKPAQGRAEMRSLLQEMYLLFDPRNVVIETTQYEFSSDVAFSIGTSTSNVKLPDGSRFDERSKWICAMRSQRGDWKIVALIHNSDLPIPR